MKRLVLSLALLLAFTSLALAEPTEDLQLKSKTKTVAVFTNGYGFVYKTESINPENEWFKMESIPKNALGTIWIGSNDSLNPIEQIIWSEEDQNSKKINKIPDTKIRLKDNKKKAEIITSYLFRGITWSPSYVLDIQNPKKPILTMDALLSSYSEDLEDTDVSFVVGYPELLAADLISREQSVNDFLHKLVSNFTSRLYAAPMSQLLDSNSSASYSSISDFKTASLYEDVYLYKKSHVTMPKASMLRVNVFNDEVDCSHFYEIELQDLMDENAKFDDNPNSSSYVKWLRNLNSYVQIWHMLKIINNTNKPFTAGPIFVVNGVKPVSQDLLKNMPPKANGIVKLSVDTDIEVEQVTTEVAKGINNYRVTKDNIISIKNTKKFPISIVVTKKIFGEVLSADNNGMITTGHGQFSTSERGLYSRVNWEGFELGAGETKKLNLKYQTVQ